ncbi:MAG: hypothetical protein AB9869_19220 [Verrucomicrobiia bacterium]
MKTLLVMIVWGILFVLCWPLALFVLIVFPIVWLLSLPFRLIFAGVEGVLAFLKAIIFLPARLLGYRNGA